MIIDGHAHAAGAYSTADSVMSTSREFGITQVVLCTSPKNNLDLKEPPNLPFMKSPSSIYLLNRMLRFGYKSFIKDYGDGNQHVFKLRDQAPDIVIPFLWVNPLDLQHMDHLEERIQRYRPKGIKLHQAWDSFTIDGSAFNQLIEVAQAHKFPVFIHLYSRSETRKLLHFICSHKDTNFIVAHMLGLDIFKEKNNLSNLYFDASGSERVRGLDILEAIDCFGYDHVIFGSDTPYAKIEAQIKKIQHLNLSDKVMEHIFRLNVEHILASGI
jgi:predicted TIM-barrel fold metal-dependent hydrolase